MEVIRAIPAFAKLELKKSAGYKRVAEGLLPPPIKIGKRAVGWPKHEINAISTLIVAGASVEAIKQCVNDLTVRRKLVVKDNSLAGGFDE